MRPKQRQASSKLGDNVFQLQSGPVRYDQIEVGRALNQLALARSGLLRFSGLPGVETFIDDLRALEKRLNALPVQPLNLVE